MAGEPLHRLADGAANAPGAHSRPADALAADGGHGLRCFLVEDSPLILQNLVATLEEMIGAEVVGHAEDEATAIEWARSHPGACDVMVIDIFLKAGSGLEVLRQVRPMAPQARLVVLTNYATSDMRRRCLELGADRVFDKSAELEELLAFCEDVGDEIAGGGPPHSRG
jgi:DNA-binding NarL/FixJ family response regulator